MTTPMPSIVIDALLDAPPALARSPRSASLALLTSYLTPMPPLARLHSPPQITTYSRRTTFWGSMQCQDGRPLASLLARQQLSLGSPQAHTL